MKKAAIIIRIVGIMFFIAFIWQGYLFIDLKSTSSITFAAKYVPIRSIYNDTDETEKMYAAKYDWKRIEDIKRFAEEIRKNKLQDHLKGTALLFTISLILFIWSLDRNKLIKNSEQKDQPDSDTSSQ